MVATIVQATGGALITGFFGVILFFLQRSEKRRKEQEELKEKKREEQSRLLIEWQEKEEQRLNRELKRRTEWEDMIAAELANTSKATRASLHDRLKWECERIILQEFRTSNDSRNITYMFEGYLGINGNSIIEDLYDEAMKQPIKPLERKCNERKSLPTPREDL